MRFSRSENLKVQARQKDVKIFTKKDNKYLEKWKCIHEYVRWLILRIRLPCSQPTVPCDNVVFLMLPTWLFPD